MLNDMMMEYYNHLTPVVKQVYNDLTIIDGLARCTYKTFGIGKHTLDEYNKNTTMYYQRDRERLWKLVQWGYVDIDINQIPHEITLSSKGHRLLRPDFIITQKVSWFDLSKMERENQLDKITSIVLAPRLKGVTADGDNEVHQNVV